MQTRNVTCVYCKIIFTKTIHRIRESQKRKWKFYCSPQCAYDAKNKQVNVICGNPAYKKSFLKEINQIKTTNASYCSQSCAAIINNHKRSLKQPPKHCANPACDKTILRRYTYCSVSCGRAVNKPSRATYVKNVLQIIRSFHTEHNRIPFKQELIALNKPARMAFGTWNKAIEAAGYKPNPVRFAQKYIANDGHHCDSMAEKIIDDWLFKKIFYIKEAYRMAKIK